MTSYTKLGFLIEIKVPVNGEIIRDGIQAPSNDIVVVGNLEYDFTTLDITGRLGMRGMWRKAFGIEWLAIGNIFFGYSVIHKLSDCFYHLKHTCAVEFHILL